MICMPDQSNMGVVGEKDAVLAFRSMGMTVRPAQSADEAAQAVRQLAADGYAVIFITETYAEKIPETLSKYINQPLPAIIPIPGANGTTGYAVRHLKANVEKAIGADILFEKDGDN